MSIYIYIDIHIYIYIYIYILTGQHFRNNRRGRNMRTLNSTRRIKPPQRDAEHIAQQTTHLNIDTARIVCSLRRMCFHRQPDTLEHVGFGYDSQGRQMWCSLRSAPHPRTFCANPTENVGRDARKPRLLRPDSRLVCQNVRMPVSESKAAVDRFSGPDGIKGDRVDEIWIWS